MMIKRTIFKEIEKSVKSRPITLIAGARQVGKSTIASLFIEKGFSYISLDSSRNRELANDGLLIVEESKEDKRSLIIYLSDKTLSLESKINRATKRMGNIFYKGLSEEEASKLGSLLNKVKENLKDE